MSDSQISPQPSSDGQHGEISPPARDGLSGNVTFNVIVPLILLSLGAAVIIAMGTVEPKSRPEDDRTRAGQLKSLPPVRVERLQSIDLDNNPLQLAVDGSVVPFREALVAAEVSGEIIFKSDQCEAGEYVQKDELLMKIDPTDYQLEVDRLTRLRQQEYEALAEIDQELKNTQRSMKVAEEDVKIQQDEVSRRLALPTGYASKAEVDQAKRSLLAAKQQMVGYENQADLARKRRLRLEASEALAATQLRAAEVNLKRCEIRAPIDGVVVVENVDLNSFVSRGATLVTIEDTSKVNVSTKLRMDQIYWVLDQNDQTSEQQPTAAGGYELPETPAIVEYVMNGRKQATFRWKGRLLGYDGIGLDPVSRTVPVRVVVDDPQRYTNSERGEVISTGPKALVRGMFVRVILLIKPRTPLVVIPARALKPGNEVWQFVPDESVLEVPAADDHVADTASSTRPDERTESAFDPNEWAPGRVVVRSSIVPVNALHPEVDSSASDNSGDDRMWVCEVRDQSLDGQSLVVTSPLADVANNDMPARADAGIVATVSSESVAARNAVLTSRVENE